MDYRRIGPTGYQVEFDVRLSSSVPSVKAKCLVLGGIMGRIEGVCIREGGCKGHAMTQAMIHLHKKRIVGAIVCRALGPYLFNERGRGQKSGALRRTGIGLACSQRSIIQVWISLSDVINSCTGKIWRSSEASALGPAAC